MGAERRFWAEAASIQPSSPADAAEPAAMSDEAATESAASDERKATTEENKDSKRLRNSEPTKKYGWHHWDEETQLSHDMVRILRWNASSHGLHPDPDGFFRVSDLLNLPIFASVDVEGIRKLVRRSISPCRGPRFELRADDNGLAISCRATSNRKVELDGFGRDSYPSKHGISGSLGVHTGTQVPDMRLRSNFAGSAKMERRFRPVQCTDFPPRWGLCEQVPYIRRRRRWQNPGRLKVPEFDPTMSFFVKAPKRTVRISAIEKAKAEGFRQFTRARSATWQKYVHEADDGTLRTWFHKEETATSKEQWFQN